METDLAALRRLPRRALETWQLRITPMTGLKLRESGQLFEPMGGFIADRRTGLAISVDVGLPGMPEHVLACSAIIKGCEAEKVRFLPGTIQVGDPELAALIRPSLTPLKIAVEVTDDLAAVDELLESFQKDMLPPRMPGWLDAPGMTPQRLVDYAQAAAEMYKAAPWQYLTGEDLLRIESPDAPKGMGFIVVMGEQGKIFGLAFYPDVKTFELALRQEDPRDSLRGEMLSLIYSDADHMPAEDEDFWLTQRLPLRNENAYPVLMRYLRNEKKMERLDGVSVTFVEGLCRALARTSETQIDSGRWEQAVETAEGRKNYVLSIPALLEAMKGAKPEYHVSTYDARARDKAMLAIQMKMAQFKFKTKEEANEILEREINGKVPELPEPRTPRERAQWLCFEAFEQRGRRRIQLARQALEICPDVADAYCLLAESRGFDLKAALKLYRQGVKAGRRALGEEPFEDEDYPFWGEINSRPYMRARLGVAQTLQALGKTAKAADEMWEILDLNPNDNQGVRYELAPLLLELGWLDDLDELLQDNDYEGDGSAQWTYVRALLSFRRQGASPEAAADLREAMRSNSRVVKYLLGREELPPVPPMYFSPGDDDEAVITALGLKDLWEETPGAVEWLERQKRTHNQNSRQKKLRRKR